jgi:hypothetical protein
VLRRLTAKQFLEWQAYATLEPFDEVRGDFRSALIASVLANVNRDSKKKPEPFKIQDFLLKFEEAEPPAKQTPAVHKNIMIMITQAFTDVPIADGQFRLAESRVEDR